jgi:hypothetical protein
MNEKVKYWNNEAFCSELGVFWGFWVVKSEYALSVTSTNGRLTEGSKGTYTYGSNIGTKIPAIAATIIFAHRNRPSHPSAGTRVNVSNGQMSRYVYEPKTAKVARVAWKDTTPDLITGR